MIGTGELGFNGDGEAGLDTALASPTSVRVDLEGRPVVVDFSNMRLRLFDGDTVQTIVGSGFHAFSEPGVDALDSPLENPIDARWSPDGLLTIAPLHEGRVIRVDADGLIERVLGTGVSLEPSGDGGPALDATMGFPAGLAWGHDGTLYVSDHSNHQVRAVAPDGTVSTVLGTGARGFDRMGEGTAVRLDAPAQLEVVDGVLLVADTGNHRIGALDLATGAFDTIVGTGEPGDGGDGGPAAEAALDDPTGLAAAEGRIWIADLGNGRLREVGTDGTITTVEAPGADALLRPAGLAVTPDGDLLIADRGAHRVFAWAR